MRAEVMLLAYLAWSTFEAVRSLYFPCGVHLFQRIAAIITDGSNAIITDATEWQAKQNLTGWKACPVYKDVTSAFGRGEVRTTGI